MKVSKGQSQPEIAAAAFLVLFMVLGRPFKYRVLILTHVSFVGMEARMRTNQSADAETF